MRLEYIGPPVQRLPNKDTVVFFKIDGKDVPYGRVEYVRSKLCISVDNNAEEITRERLYDDNFKKFFKLFEPQIGHKLTQIFR